MGSNVHRVRIFQGSDGQWYYETKAKNGRVLTVSEGYTRRSSAKRAAAKEYPQAQLTV